MTAGAVLGSGTKLSQFGGATVQQLTTEQSKINAAQELNLPGVQQSPAALASIYAMLQQGGLDTTKWKDNWHDINAYVNSATGPLKLTGNLIQQNKSYTDALAVSMANVNNDVMTVAKSIGAIISSAESTAIAAPVVKDIQAIATTIQGSKDWKNTIAQNLTLTPDQLTSVAAPISDMFTQVLSQTGSVDAAKQAVDNYMTNLHFSPAQQRQVDDMISHLFTNDGKTASVDTINNYLKGLHFTGAQITAIDKALGLSPVIKPTVDTSGIKPIVFTFDTVFNAPTGSPLAMQEAALAGFDPSKVKYSFGPGPTVVQTVSGLGSRPTQHGMKLPGYGGGDRIPILAEAGEAIVSKEMTRKYAGVLKAMGVPGMQGGGFIGSASAPYSSPARSGGSGGNVYIGKIEINVPPGVENPTAYGQKVAESLNKHFAAGGSIGSQSYRTKNRDPWYGN